MFLKFPFCIVCTNKIVNIHIDLFYIEEYPISFLPVINLHEIRLMLPEFNYCSVRFFVNTPQRIV